VICWQCAPLASKKGSAQVVDGERLGRKDCENAAEHR
jgi:hypothetical protein